MELLRISVIMPVALHEDCKKSIEALKKVDYPAEKIELITVKGNRPCTQRNKAASMAKGEILYFLDNDSIVDTKIFKKAVAYYSDKNVAGVGGTAITHDTNTFLQKSFGLMLGSFFAAQAMASRYRRVGKARKATEKELILCNFSMRRQVFENVKGFNESLYPNEENELMNRVISKGYSLIYDPNINICRSQRDTVKKFARQIFNCGWGRTRQFLIQPSFFQPLFILP
ncbi:MAG: glycosyltransferase, partial [Candidatus Woesearchaeota archaeon]